MKNLFIKKSVIEDHELSDEAFAVYCALRSIITATQQKYFISCNMIAYILFARVPTRRESEAIKKGIAELVGKEEIKVLNIFSKTECEADLSNLYFTPNSGYFSDIAEEEMKSIMAINTSANKYKLLRYYACMLGSFNRSNRVHEKYRGKIGGLSMEHFAQLLDISERTIAAYNNILEENKLLYIIRNDFQSITDSGNTYVRELPNTYSRYKDKELAIDYSSATNSAADRAKRANNKRSLAQKYNNFCNGKEYDLQTIYELYNYCIEFNNSGQDKKRNIEVFANYLDDIKRISERKEKPLETAAFSIG